MSLESDAISLVATWLAASATWSAITGASIIQAEGTTTQPSAAYAVIDVLGAADLDRTGSNGWLGTVEVSIDLLWPSHGEVTAAAEVAAARNRFAQIRADLLDTSGAAQLQRCSGEPPVLLDESADPAGWWSSRLTLTLLCIP